MEVDVFVVAANLESSWGGAYGRGLTLNQAKDECKKYGGKLGNGYTILKFGEGSTFKGFDDSGSYYWEGKEPEVTEVPPYKRKHPETDRRRTALKRAVPKEDT